MCVYVHTKQTEALPPVPFTSLVMQQQILPQHHQEAAAGEIEPHAGESDVSMTTQQDESGCDERHENAITQWRSQDIFREVAMLWYSPYLT